MINIILEQNPAGKIRPRTVSDEEYDMFMETEWGRKRERKEGAE